MPLPASVLPLSSHIFPVACFSSLILRSFLGETPLVSSPLKILLLGRVSEHSPLRARNELLEPVLKTIFLFKKTTYIERSNLTILALCAPFPWETTLFLLLARAQALRYFYEHTSLGLDSRPAWSTSSLWPPSRMLSLVLRFSAFRLSKYVFG